MAQILPYTFTFKREKLVAISAMQGNPREAGLLGYLAGIIDGEGTIGIKKHLPRGKNRTMCYFLYLEVGMTNKEVLSLFQEIFGGSLNKDRSSGRNKTMWRWNATGKIHIAAIINTLMPYLRVKKSEAMLALNCCETWALQEKPGQYFQRTSEDELLRREDAYQKMRKLKHGEHPQRLNELAPETVKR